MTIIYLALPNAADVYQPFIWALAALTMTVGNVLALRQTNIVRMLAYSSVSQGGFILMPLAFAGEAEAAGSALNAVVVYLLVYGFMNLGAFAVVIAVSRKTRSGEISSFGGLFGYAPGLAVLTTIFFASLAGIPPLGGWFAKFNAFKAVLDAQNNWAYALASIAAVNTVISAAYYMKVLRVVWMDDAPDGDMTPIVTPQPNHGRPGAHRHRHYYSGRVSPPRCGLWGTPRPQRRCPPLVPSGDSSAARALRELRRVRR